jgi:mono/diheme cytochrome c family protein
MSRSHGATAKPARRSAIARFRVVIAGIAAVCAVLAVTANTSSASGPHRDAEATYLESCARCHAVPVARAQKRESTATPRFPGFNDCEMLSMMSDATLFLAIRSGAAAIGAQSKMPAYDHVLSYDQITALVVYVRKLCSARSQPLLTAP